jgi:hypothetical protein
VEASVKVFISHSSADSWIARRIAEDLAALDVKTFLDAKDIETGESIDESIRNHLEESDEILILVSPIALTSQWVFMESGGAHVLKKRMIPILLNVAAEDLPLPIARYLGRDINEIEKYYEELKKRATQATQPERPQELLQSPESVWRNREFRVGDRVRIIDTPPDDWEEPPMWDEHMSQYLGYEATIIRKSTTNNLSLDVDQAAWLWSPRWLCLVWPAD